MYMKKTHLIRLYKSNSSLCVLKLASTDALLPSGLGFNYLYMGRVARKPVFGVSDKASFEPVSSATETS